MVRSALIVLVVLMATMALLQVLEARTNQAPPVWPAQFQQSFKENVKYGPLHSQTSGQYYYDAINNYTRIDRDNGKYDRYCGSVWKLKNTPCTHLVRSGVRYLIAPQLKKCCTCCHAAHGCGILSRNWLNNATYVGVEKYNGITVNKWNKPGLQANFYAATADEKQIPVFVDMPPNDYMEWGVESYKERLDDPSVFNLPSYCDPNEKCPRFSICSLLGTGKKQFQQL